MSLCHCSCQPCPCCLSLHPQLQINRASKVSRIVWESASSPWVAWPFWLSIASTLCGECCPMTAPYFDTVLCKEGSLMRDPSEKNPMSVLWMNAPSLWDRLWTLLGTTYTLHRKTFIHGWRGWHAILKPLLIFNNSHFPVQVYCFCLVTCILCTITLFQFCVLADMRD